MESIRRLEFTTLDGYFETRSRIDAYLQLPNDNGTITYSTDSPIVHEGKYVMYIADEALPALSEAELDSILYGYVLPDGEENEL